MKPQEDDPPRIRVCVTQCAYCRRFRNGVDWWAPWHPSKPEDRIISHGICPECHKLQKRQLHEKTPPVM